MDFQQIVRTKGLGHVPVEERTPEMCRLALKMSNGKAIRFVEPQTEEMCLLAVRQEVRILRECAFLQIRHENRTEAVCIAAVTTHSSVLQFIEAQTEAICIAAVRAKTHMGPKALQMVKRQTHAICLAAVETYGEMLEFVDAELRTADICLAAIRSDGTALRFVPAALLTADLYLAAVQQSGLVLTLVPAAFRSAAVCEAAINSCVRDNESDSEQSMLELVPIEFRTTDLCNSIVCVDGYSLEFVPDELKTLEMCISATSNDERDNSYIMGFVPKPFRYDVYEERERRKQAEQAARQTFKIRDDQVYEFDEETRTVGRCVGRLSFL